MQDQVFRELTTPNMASSDSADFGHPVAKDDREMTWETTAKTEVTPSWEDGLDQHQTNHHNLSPPQASIADEIRILTTAADSIAAEDFRILQRYVFGKYVKLERNALYANRLARYCIRFEYFLSRVQNLTALQHLVVSWVDRGSVVRRNWLQHLSELVGISN